MNRTHLSIAALSFLSSMALCLPSPRAADLCFADAVHLSSCHPKADLWRLVPWIGFSTDEDSCSWSEGSFPYPVTVTISNSPSDPYAISGDLPESGQLFVWILNFFEAPPSYGWGTIAAQLGGDLETEIEEYFPIAAGDHRSNYWNSEFWFQYQQCDNVQDPTVLLGMIQLGTTSVEPESWGRVKALYR